MTTRNKKPAKPKKRASSQASQADKQFVVELSSRLGRVNERYELIVLSLAEKVRARLLVPFCEKYELSFCKDVNGRFSFWSRGQPHFIEEMAAVEADAKHLLRLLRLECGLGESTLGAWVRPYTPRWGR